MGTLARQARKGSWPDAGGDPTYIMAMDLQEAMDARTKTALGLLWVVAAVVAGAALVIFASSQLLKTGGVVLVVVGMVSIMPTMQFMMESLGSTAAE